MQKPATATRRKFSTYAKRARALKRIGFASYADYLASDLWKKVREIIFRLKGKICRCGRPATQLHHQHYAKCDLTGKRTKHIHPICGNCHTDIEFAMDGTKLDLIEVRRLFNARR